MEIIIQVIYKLLCFTNYFSDHNYELKNWIVFKFNVLPRELFLIMNYINK